MGIIYPIAKIIKPISPVFIVLALGLFFLPYIYWPFSVVPYELPRVFFVHRFVELFVLVGVLTKSTKSKLSMTQPLGIILILWGGLVFLSVFTGVDSLKSIGGNPYRGDGMLTFMRLIGLSVAVCLFIERRLFPKILYSLAIGAIGVGILTVGNWIAIFYHKEIFAEWYGSQGIMFGQPEFLGGYLVISIPAVLYFLSTLRLSIFIRISMFIPVIIAMILTQSWGSQLVSVAVIGVWIVKRLQISPIKKNLIVFLIVGVIGVFGSIGWIYKNRLPTNVSAESRERIFMKMSLGFLKRPLFGWGWANADKAFTSVDWPYHYEVDANVDKAHSTVLEMFVTTGVLGGIFYVGLLCFLLIHFWYFSKTLPVYWTLFLMMLAYILHSQTNIVAIAEEFIFFVLVGVALKKN